MILHNFVIINSFFYYTTPSQKTFLLNIYNYVFFIIKILNFLFYEFISLLSIYLFNYFTYLFTKEGKFT